jgi:crossover junction endodeoxyribonuclease RuvC
MKILGIDPGSVVCGWGIIEKGSGGKIALIEYGVIKAKKITAVMPERLKEIYLRLYSVIERTQPDSAAFESMFFAKNAQSLIKLSQARSAAIIAAAMHNLPIFEYAPREVKKSVTGNGNASKTQVQFMVRSMLKIEETPEFFDATDALAVAICHSIRSSVPASSAKSWKDFIEQNPNRVAKGN